MTIEVQFQVCRGDFTLEVELTIPARGVTAFFGPSGCGKTTLLRVIAGLERGVKGNLSVDGKIWQDEQSFLPPHRRPLGYVFQEPSLFSHLTVRGNLEYGCKRLRKEERKVSLQRAVELLGIGHLLERRPHQLSGGEQQRVAIARALAVSPALLLLDEPLAALDQARKQEILPYLESLHQELEIPVLYVSHSRDEVARMADYLVLLEAGRIQAAGPVGELFTRLDLPLAQGPETESVIETVIAGHDEVFELTFLEFPGGQFTVPRVHRPQGTPIRLQVKANDVSITLEPQVKTSILNIFPATVDQLAEEGSSRATVRMLVGTVPILSRITRKSAVELDLKPGKVVYAQIKGVALLS